MAQLGSPRLGAPQLCSPTRKCLCPGLAEIPVGAGTVSHLLTPPSRGHSVTRRLILSPPLPCLSSGTRSSCPLSLCASHGHTPSLRLPPTLPHSGWGTPRFACRWPHGVVGRQAAATLHAEQGSVSKECPVLRSGPGASLQVAFPLEPGVWEGHWPLEVPRAEPGDAWSGLSLGGHDHVTAGWIPGLSWGGGLPPAWLPHALWEGDTGKTPHGVQGAHPEGET